MKRRKIDRMVSTSPKDIRDGAPKARVHGVRISQDPEYDTQTLTLEEWKAQQNEAR